MKIFVYFSCKENDKRRFNIESQTCVSTNFRLSLMFVYLPVVSGGGFHIRLNCYIQFGYQCFIFSIKSYEVLWMYDE